LLQGNTFLVQIKPHSSNVLRVTASTVFVTGDHLVFFNAKGKLSAHFMVDVVERYDEMEGDLRVPLFSFLGRRIVTVRPRRSAQSHLRKPAPRGIGPRLKHPELLRLGACSNRVDLSRKPFF
jgi:hypothetical protein